MKLSIVSTMYYSSPFLPDFTKRIQEVAERITRDYEIILVNDGSPDDALSVALSLQTQFPAIRIIDLSRNFGHHAAIIAGLEKARGDFVFLIDCDLEEQPEWLLLFHEEMKISNADVVFGAQQKRIASMSSNFFAENFWRIFNILSSVKIPHNPMTCRLMNRSYVDGLLSVGDRALYLGGVFAWAGFKQQVITLEKKPRPSTHKTTYSLSRKLLQVVDAFSSFSVAPLYLVFITGVFTCFASIVYGIYLLIYKILWPEVVLSGFTSLMLSIWLLGGIIIVSMGITGLYISKIFQEVKRRPLFIVKKVYERERP